MEQRRTVIDTDFGTNADDAIAVALALASQEIEVQAFTVVGRQSVYRKQMLEKFLATAGEDCARPPVYAGWDAPPRLPTGFSLVAPCKQGAASSSFPGADFGAHLASLGSAHRFSWFGVEGTLDRNSPTRASTTPQAGDATYEAGEKLHALLCKGDTDLIALGPLTNLYQLLTNTHYDAAKVSIPSLTVMGIHLRPTPYGRDALTGVDAFVPACADYNLACDPVSTLYVLNELAKPSLTPPAASAIRAARWVTADVTFGTRLNQLQLSKLAQSRHPFLLRLVEMIEAWTPIMTKRYAHAGMDNAVFLHDPLTLACAFGDEWCNFETLHLEPVLTNDYSLRWIRHEAPAPGAIPLTCAVSLKTRAAGQTFSDWLVERLLAKFS
ncbi:MAG TPA: nucleoside hydrolase [Pyrinomonadaceae bacterium]|nr:nucleoside hydrolase [Pyrinomonadaceae bacterium]